MSSQEGWNDRAEFEFLRLAIRGLTSSFQRLENNFLRLARNWLLAHYALALHPFELLQIGNTESPLNPTERLREYRLERICTHNSVNGLNQTWVDLNIPVSAVLPVTLVIRTAPLGLRASSPGGGLVLSPPFEGAWNTTLLGVLALILLGRRKSLILFGPTRLGKTLWARSLGSHAYFGGLFSLDEPLKDVEYAVFDDMQGGFGYFHSFKFWLGCQSQFYATDKYKGKTLIHWGRPSIYICNDNPLADPAFANRPGDIDWLTGNCEIVEINESLLVPVEGGVGLEV